MKLVIDNLGSKVILGAAVGTLPRSRVQIVAVVPAAKAPRDGDVLAMAR
jgi:hypothetical protein